MSDRVGRNESSYNKGAVYCTQKIHSPFHPKHIHAYADSGPWVLHPRSLGPLNIVSLCRDFTDRNIL